MRDDDRLSELFQNIRFADEPPMESLAIDDARRGRRVLRRRRRRATTWTSASVGVAALATGAAVALPYIGGGGGEPLEVAGATDTPAVSAAADANAAAALDAFAGTRALLLDVAARHFDPDRLHLPDSTSNSGSGHTEHGQRISTKLDWTVPGEDGLGMLHVVVTTAGYAEGEYAAADVATLVGCDDVDLACATEVVTDSGETVLVFDEDPEHPWRLSLGAMYERADGSFTAVGAFTLFGNNSADPVSEVAIDREQAIAFVTDPDLHVLVDEVAAESDRLAAEQATGDVSDNEGDFSRSDVVAVPDTKEMSDDEAREALDECVHGSDDWEGFDPEFGVWIDADGQRLSWVIAARGATMMLCEDSGASLFGTSTVKGSPYLTGDVHVIHQTFGRHVQAVDRVTVQFSGGPESEAVMRDGYWYLPGGGSNPGPVAWRGYYGGELVYSSLEDDPDTCYTDPDGTEITRYGSDDSPDIEDCLPMLEWDR